MFKNLYLENDFFYRIEFLGKVVGFVHLRKNKNGAIYNPRGHFFLISDFPPPLVKKCPYKSVFFIHGAWTIAEHPGGVGHVVYGWSQHGISFYLTLKVKKNLGVWILVNFEKSNK